MKLNPLPILLSLFLFNLSTLFAEPIEIDSETTTASSRPTLGPELGLTMQFLIPNSLPSFQLPVTAFGPHIGVPLFGSTLQVQGVYGGNEKVSLYNIEIAYRYNIFTPFFTAFVFGGVHYLHYGYQNDDHSFFGPMTGIGFYFPMAEFFSMGLGMKFYLPQKLMLGFGGSFAYVL